MLAFVARFESELTFGQVLIRRSGSAFDLRHIEDRDLSEGKLLRLTRAELRRWSQRTQADAYRPLKSSPTLAPGWTYHCSDIDSLDDALQIIYPGSVVDWYAGLAERPPVTNYRDFTNRQSGMYRITQLLSDSQAASVIEAACDAKFCLKRRLWSVEGFEPDPSEGKSIIPCLEPCAVFLEFARKAVRIEQEAKAPVSLSASELSSIESALNCAIDAESTGAREAEVGDALNRRRLQLLLIKLKTVDKPGLLKE